MATQTNQLSGVQTVSTTESEISQKPLGRFGQCSALQAGEAAKILLGLYPKGQVDDPDTYAAGIATILAAYPTDVVQQICSPWGLPTRVKWLPSVYEVKEACEIAMGPYYAQEAKKQHEEEMGAQKLAHERKYGPIPLTEEQRAANVARFNKILAQFKKDVPVESSRPKIVGDLTIAEAELKLQQIKPIGPELGDDLRRLTGVKSEE
jgi:hypothetical protein